MSKNIEVRCTLRDRSRGQRKTWSVYVNGQLVEGGFFSREAAQSCANELRTEYPEITDADLR